MAHIREVRPHACELKFVVEPDVAVKIRLWARTHLDPDANGLGPFGDEYQTTSVYYDTAAYDVFHRRGSFGRSKYRIRRYGDEQTVFLERKMRQPAVLAKRRTQPVARVALATDRADARRRVARLLVPSPRDGQAAAAGLSSRLFPDGTGRRAQRRTGPPDARLRPSGACPRAMFTFRSRSGVPAAMRGTADPRVEVSAASPPAIFRQLVEEFALTPQTASKYRLGVVALGLAVAQQGAPGAGTAASYA